MPLSLLPIIFSGPGSNLYPLCEASSSSSPSSSCKALLPLANRPLLAYALQNLLSAGLTSCLLLAPSSQHVAITKAISAIRLTSPVTPSIQSEKKKARDVKDEKKVVGVAVVDSISHSTSEATTMKVELLSLGPHDGKDVGKMGSTSDDFRRQNLGTAELLRWVASLDKLQADPLIMPIDLLSPSMPLRQVIDLYIGAQADSQESPTACCALYERAAGEGTGREREKEGPPCIISAYSQEDNRLLLLRDAEISNDMTFRRSLLQACPLMRLSTRLLDSHVYIFNRKQIIPLLEANPVLTSLREHVLPLIAKASWMEGLQEKAGWTFSSEQNDDEEDHHDDEGDVKKRLAILSKDETLTRQMIARSSTSRSKGEPQHRPIRCLTVVSRLQKGSDDAYEDLESALPRFVARANTLPTYLECNRWLLKAVSQQSALPFALPLLEQAEASSQVAAGAEPLQAPSAQISADSIIGIGVRIGERASIKRSIVGNRCEIGRGVRLAGCILMDGCKVLENARLENVILCVDAKVGEASTLKECDVAAGVELAANTHVKNEKLVSEQDDEDDEED